MKTGAVTLPEYGKNEGLRVPHRFHRSPLGFEEGLRRCDGRKGSEGNDSEEDSEEKERVFLVGNLKNGTRHVCVKREGSF